MHISSFLNWIQHRIHFLLTNKYLIQLLLLCLVLVKTLFLLILRDYFSHFHFHQINYVTAICMHEKHPFLYLFYSRYFRSKHYFSASLILGNAPLLSLHLFFLLFLSYFVINAFSTP